ncbi:hypothetical protein F4861DRAFT_535496 [Xylaria intraflava]|nr:hypothetical protein F4861DRAFT_535496 [Xylaria intraflava]
MGSTKQYFTSKKAGGMIAFNNGTRTKSLLSEGGFENLVTRSSPQLNNLWRSSGDTNPRYATTGFIPKDRGREETMALLRTGTSESLSMLLKERDQASKQVKKGPQTKGTEAVQRILQQPSRKSVEHLHQAKQQAEAENRYGASGVVAYNFSKTLGWNQAWEARLPGLQLRSETRMGEIRNMSTSIPAIPLTPIDWIMLPETVVVQGPTVQQVSSFGSGYEQQEQPDRPWSPVSEPGGWRDGEGIDIADLRQDPMTPEIVLRDTEEGRVFEEDEQYQDHFDPFDICDVPDTPFWGKATAIRITTCSTQILKDLVWRPPGLDEMENFNPEMARDHF